MPERIEFVGDDLAFRIRVGRLASEFDAVNIVTQALCALGAIEAERGLHATAAARYVRLSELSEAAGERDDARLAAHRAGELFMRVSPKEAIPWLERTLAGARDDVQAATLLCDAYAADGRWQDLLRLERWRLTQAQQEPATEAVGSALVLDEVARREDIGVSENEIDAELERYASRSGLTVPAVRAQLEQEGSLERLAAGIRREKALARVMQQVRIVEL